MTLQVYDWWREPSERDAFDSVTSLDESLHPGITINNAVTVDNADELRGFLNESLLASAPPSTFQANIGADLLRWTVVDTDDATVVSSSRIEPLDAVFAGGDFGAQIQPRLLNELRVGAGTSAYGVPLNIHRLNMLYYDPARLAAYESRHGGQTFLDLDVLCPSDVETRISDATQKPDLVIATGTGDQFPMTLLAFESLLPAIWGADFYDALFHGQASGDWATEVHQTLACVEYLSRSFLTDRANPTWAQAAQRVADGDADLTVMGDWVNGELKTQLFQGEVVGVPFPRAAQVAPFYVFTSDTFPLPIGAPHPTEALDLLNTMASAEGQRVFSSEKGSIPARRDVDVSDEVPNASNTVADFESDQVLKEVATSGLFPPYFDADKLNELLLAIASEPGDPSNVDAAAEWFEDAEPLFARWQTRLAQGAAPPP